MPLTSIVDGTPDLPATRESIAADLAALGVQTGSLLLVHSSLSALGWVCGGAVAVVQALMDAIGPVGTLVMPTHTSDLSEPEHWQNPPVPQSWWPVIRASMPAFDPNTTPSQHMGAIAEYFRTLPDVQRSHHPHHSFAALGPLATEITDNHPLEQGLGDSSPLGSIYAHKGSVLLLGVEHDRNTSLHLSEYRVLPDAIASTKNGAPIFVNDSRQWVTFMERELGDHNFSTLGEAMEQETDLVTHGHIAQAKSRLMPQVGLVDFGIDWLTT